MKDKKSFLRGLLYIATVTVIAVPVSANGFELFGGLSWDKVSNHIKFFYYKDSLFEDEDYKYSYRLGAILVDDFDCSGPRLERLGMWEDDAWPNEYLWYYLKHGTIREKFYAATIAIDSTNIKKGFENSSNGQDFLSERYIMIDYIINNLIINGGDQYDNICGRRYRFDNGRNNLISGIIYTYLYSEFAKTHRISNDIDKYLPAMKTVYVESTIASGFTKNLEDEIRRWPRIYDDL